LNQPGQLIGGQVAPNAPPIGGDVAFGQRCQRVRRDAPVANAPAGETAPRGYVCVVRPRPVAASIPSHPAALQVVINEHYKQGMLSSFQAGIRALPPDVSAALFTLVDHPAVRESTLDQLLAAFEREQPLLVIPRYEGQRGHPVVAERTILNEILSLPADASPKNVIRAHRAETVFVDVDDRGVVTDVDLPEEYDELRASS
jgi:CTP:molybdopterin cytidylyltransferase MocA